MKRRLFALLAVCAVALSACAGMAISDPAPVIELERDLPAPAEAESFEAPEYEVVPFTSGNLVRSEDGKEVTLASYNYQTILLVLHNEGAVSPEDAEAAARNVEAFNAKMRTIHGELSEQGEALAGEAQEFYETFGPLSAEYEDDVTMAADFQGDIVSVCMERYTDAGGAHPNRYASCWLFDLAGGQFVDPTQIAEAPESFRTGAAALLLEKADAHPEREAFWQDYADIIAHWNEGAVRFTGEGMEVLYSPYGLGPYVIGEVELSLDWEELEPLIGPSGMARLGQGEME